MSSISVHSGRVARPNGWWGMAVFVATEATFFGTLIGTWIYLRFYNAHWPPRGVPLPAVLTPTLLTLALLSTSIFMQLAWHAGRDRRRQAAWGFVAVAFSVQLFYLVWQLHDYVDLWHVYDPRASAFASIFLTLLAADHAHVAIGILMNAWLLLKLATRLTRYRLTGLQAITFYWHAVNTITAVVLLVQLSPHL